VKVVAVAVDSFLSDPNPSHPPPPDDDMAAATGGLEKCTVGHFRKSAGLLLARWEE